MDTHSHRHPDHSGHQHPLGHPDGGQRPKAEGAAALKDPVCGMTVTEQSPHHAEHEGRPYYFCSAKCLAKFAAEPGKYAAAARAAPHRLRPRRRAGHDLHLPDAPGDPPGPSGQLPQVRHDTGAGAARARRRPRTRNWSTSSAASGGRCRLTVVVTVLAMFGHRLGWFDMATQSWIELVLHAADRAVGRLALLRARRAVDRQPQPEHVDADRPGHRRGLRLQRRRHGRAAGVPGVVRVDGAGGGVLRGGGGDHLADAARSDPGAEGALADLGGDQVAARPGAEDRAPHRRRRQRGGRAARRTCTSATCCACGRARRCRSTASSSKAAARSTSRCSPASRCR